MSEKEQVEAVARAICEASQGQWRTNEGLTEQAIKILDNDALNNHWRYVARAAIAALQSRPPNLRARSRWATSSRRHGHGWRESGPTILAMAKDAARYHWLRDHSCPPHNFYISVPDEFSGVRYGPSEVDAYIDDARQALAAPGEPPCS